MDPQRLFLCTPFIISRELLQRGLSSRPLQREKGNEIPVAFLARCANRVDAGSTSMLPRTTLAMNQRIIGRDAEFTELAPAASVSQVKLSKAVVLQMARYFVRFGSTGSSPGRASGCWPSGQPPRKPDTAGRKSGHDTPCKSGCCLDAMYRIRCGTGSAVQSRRTRRLSSDRGQRFADRWGRGAAGCGRSGRRARRRPPECSNRSEPSSPAHRKSAGRCARTPRPLTHSNRRTARASDAPR